MSIDNSFRLIYFFVGFYSKNSCIMTILIVLFSRCMIVYDYAKRGTKGKRR